MDPGPFKWQFVDALVIPNKSGEILFGWYRPFFLSVFDCYVGLISNIGGTASTKEVYRYRVFDISWNSIYTLFVDSALIYEFLLGFFFYDILVIVM